MGASYRPDNPFAPGAKPQTPGDYSPDNPFADTTSTAAPEVPAVPKGPGVVDRALDIAGRVDQAMSRDIAAPANAAVGRLARAGAQRFRQWDARRNAEADRDLIVTPDAGWQRDIDQRTRAAEDEARQMREGTLAPVRTVERGTPNRGLSGAIANFVSQGGRAGMTPEDETKVQALTGHVQQFDPAEYRRVHNALVQRSGNPALSNDERARAASYAQQLEAQRAVMQRQGAPLTVLADELTMGLASRPERQALERMRTQGVLLSPDDIREQGVQMHGTTLPNPDVDQGPGVLGKFDPVVNQGIRMAGGLGPFLVGEGLVGAGARGLGEALVREEGTGLLASALRAGGRAVQWPYAGSRNTSLLLNLGERAAQGAVQGQIPGMAMAAAHGAVEGQDPWQAAKASVLPNATMGAALSMFGGLKGAATGSPEMFPVLGDPYFGIAGAPTPETRQIGAGFDRAAYVRDVANEHATRIGGDIRDQINAQAAERKAPLESTLSEMLTQLAGRRLVEHGLQRGGGGEGEAVAPAEAPAPRAARRRRGRPLAGPATEWGADVAPPEVTFSPESMVGSQAVQEYLASPAWQRAEAAGWRSYQSGPRIRFRAPEGAAEAPPDAGAQALLDAHDMSKQIDPAQAPVAVQAQMQGVSPEVEAPPPEQPQLGPEDLSVPTFMRRGGQVVGQERPDPLVTPDTPPSPDVLRGPPGGAINARGGNGAIPTTDEAPGSTSLRNRYLKRFGLPALAVATAGGLSAYGNQDDEDQNSTLRRIGRLGGLAATAAVATSAMGREGRGGDERALEVAQEYNAKHGFPPIDLRDYARVDPERATRIAAHYEAAPVNARSPRVQRSYETLAREVDAQYQHLLDNGVRFEFTEQNPYANSAEMMADLRDNNRLKVLKTPDDAFHPLLTPEQNNKLRAVHDYFGHAAHGNQFGPRGEENAWIAHSKMFSPEARRALTTETRGQNSWVNYGPHGEQNRADPANTRYADQKTFVLPEEFVATPDEGVPPGMPSVPPERPALVRGEQGIVPQEAASYGRHGFIPGSDRAPREFTQRLTDAVRQAMFDEDGQNRIAHILAARHGYDTGPTVSGGEGRYKGDTNPNLIFHFGDEAPDEAVATTAALHGLLLGQDASTWWRHVPEGTEGAKPGHVVTGDQGAPLSEQTLRELDSILASDPKFAPLNEGSTTADGHVLFRNFSDVPEAQYARLIDEAMGQVQSTDAVERHVGQFVGDYYNGPRKYLEVIGQDPDTLREAGRLFQERIAPVYEQFGEEAGVGDETRQRLDATSKAVEALARQHENPPLQSNKRGRAILDVMQELAGEQRNPLPPDVPPQKLRRRLTDTFTRVVHDFMGTAPDAERAADWYGSEVGDAEAIATLLVPELRRPAMRTLYHAATSILSNGQQVANEYATGTNVMEQFIRTGKFSKFDPSGATDVSEHGEIVPAAGRGINDEPIKGSARNPAHEAGFQKLNALLQEMTPEQVSEYLMSDRTLKNGKRRAASVEEFGKKIGQYFRDKLGLPDNEGSTIDSWMHRLYQVTRGSVETEPARVKVGKDARNRPIFADHPTERVQSDSPTDAENAVMQEVMRRVAGRVSQETGLTVKPSSVQAMLWYHVKRIMRDRGATEKPGAYDTPGSAMAQFATNPPWEGPAWKKKAGAAAAGAGLLAATQAGTAGAGTVGNEDDQTKGVSTALKVAGGLGALLVARAAAGAIAERAGTQLPSNPARPILNAMREAADTPAGRVAGATGLAAVGALLNRSDPDEHPELHRTGAPLIALGALAALGTGNLGRMGGAGGRRLVDALAQGERGRALLRYVNPDLLLDAPTKKVLEDLRAGRAFALAKAAEHGRGLRKLSPQADRLVSDLREGEQWEDPSKMHPDDVNAAVAMTAAIDADMNAASQAALQAGVIGPEGYRAHQGTYMKRLYGQHIGEAVMGERPQRTSIMPRGESIRTRQVKRRTLDDLPANLQRQARESLGEIRESSVRVPVSLEETWTNVANAKALSALKQTPGLVHQDFIDAHDNLQTGRYLLDQARQSGNAQDRAVAQQLIDDAKGEIARVTTRYSSPGGQEWVALPDSRSLGDLRGAVVSRDIYNQINGLNNRGKVGGAMRFWKRNKTVWNPGTHVGNVMSNTVMAHMAGLPLWQQGEYLTSAFRDMQRYGPATKALAEAGVLGHNAIFEGHAGRDALSRANLARLKETTRPVTRAALDAAGVPDQPGRLRRGAQAVNERMQNAYLAEDDVFRVAMYQKAIKPRDQGGMGMSPSEAVDHARESLIDFRSNSQALSDVANTVAPFIRYPAKALPTFAKHVIDHPWRYATLMAAWAGLNEYSKQTEGPIKERDLAPQDRRDAGYFLPGLTQLPFTDARGGKAAFDFARWTPLTFLTSGAPPGSPGYALSDNFPGGLIPSSPWISLGAKFGANTDPYTGKKLVQAGMTGRQKAGALGGALYDEVVPPLAGMQARRLYEDVTNRDVPGAMNDALGFSALRPRYTRPGSYPIHATFEYQQELREIQQDINSRARRAANNPDKVRALAKEEAERMQELTERYRNRVAPHR